jgi:hypothetical protein
MFWLWDENIDDDEDIDDGIDEGAILSWRAEYILKRIRELKSLNLISIAETEELVSLDKELKEIQSSCFHSFETVLLFNGHRRFCKWCDKEDTLYKHQP